ncbi:MAG: class I SAM-dependent methyltransferase [Patescibacteria group bacterium]
MSYNYQEYNTYLHSTNSDHNRLLKPLLTNFFNQSEYNSILDIGCGSGYIAQVLQSTNYKGNYLGVDSDKLAVDYCKVNIKSQNYSFLQSEDFLQQKIRFDLSIFCLSACEMNSQTLENYLRRIKSDQLLIINPSTITNYYNSTISKTLSSKILSRIGVKSNWVLKAKVENYANGFYIKHINQNKKIKAKVYQRTTGDLLNLTHKSNWEFQEYWNLSYTKNTNKTAPAPKFEICLFKSLSQ